MITESPGANGDGVRSLVWSCRIGDDTHPHEKHNAWRRQRPQVPSFSKMQIRSPSSSAPTLRHMFCRISKHSKGQGVQLTKVGSRLIKKPTQVPFSKVLVYVAAAGALVAMVLHALADPDRVSELREAHSWRVQAARLCAMGSEANVHLRDAMDRYGADPSEWAVRDGVAEALHCIRCYRNPMTGLCEGHPSQDVEVSPFVVDTLVETVNAESNIDRKQARVSEVTRRIDFRFDFAVYSQLLRSAVGDIEYPAPPMPHDYRRRARVKPEVTQAWCEQVGPAIAEYAKHQSASWLTDALATAQGCGVGKLASPSLAQR